MEPIITLTTDFGWRDTYVAAMKGSILAVNPHATMVDISHSIEPQNIFEAAFLLHTVWPYFPQDSVHIVVVDPGVGSERRALLIKAPRAYFIAPDNGVLSYVLADISTTSVRRAGRFPRLPGDLVLREVPPGVEARIISEPRFWHQPVSATFHGRDIFAPVAAHLSLGVPPSEFGEAVASLFVFPIPQPRIDAQGVCYGHIVHRDSFGNLITDVAAADISPGNLSIEVGGQRIDGLSACYSEGGELLATIGSSGYLEVAARNGSAVQRLGVGVGDPISIKKL